MEIRHLRIFMEVASAGSVSETARRLNIAQSALSRRIQQLEASLGAELFLRRVDGIALTDAGRRLLGRAAPLLADFDRLQDDLVCDAGREASRIKLGITASAASLLLNGLTRRVHEQLPDVLLQVVEGGSEHLRSWLVAGEIDLALLTNPRPGRAVEILKLWRESIFLVAAPRLAAEGRPLSLADVAHLPFLMTTRSPGVRPMFEAIFRRAGLKLSVDMELEGIASVKRIVEAGEAFTIVPYHAIAREVAAGQLCVGRLDEAYISRGLARRSGVALAGPKKKLVTLLIAEAERQLATLEWATLLPDARAQRWTAVGRPTGGKGHV